MVFRIGPKSEVLFGEHASDQTGERTRALGCSKVLCVYDQGVKEAGVVGPVLANLEKAGLEIVHYDKVLPDPPDTMVNECGELARKEQVDGVVGVGGGSTLDTAKAVNVMLGNPGPIENYYLGPGAPGHKPGKPLVLVPTTAGTGSEITYVAVLTRTALGTKNGILGPATIASLAIVDPLLTLGLPPAITAATGMDTFAHALEAYTAAGQNMMSDVLSEKAIELTVHYLPKAVKNGSDVEARTNMSFACLIAGMSFTDAKTHFGHAFGHSLGARHHIPHGTGCAIAQPGVIEIVADLMPKKVRRVGEIMGLKLGANLSSAELGKRVSDSIVAFNKEIGVPTLRQLNVKESDFVPLAEGLMKDVCFSFMPVKLGMRDVLKVIQDLYAL
ncbi:MAG: iron-containing alcohol dehydrogenase [Syntrophorhabdales bacterium]|jgi:alcohol dehydrogenase class IV